VFSSMLPQIYITEFSFMASKIIWLQLQYIYTHL
jgi:hypothetical protein